MSADIDRASSSRPEVNTLQHPSVWVSIHDVMPDTLPRVERLLSLFDSHQRSSVDLLVVPGKRWTRGEIEQLRFWVEQGHQLVGHGWLHHTDTRRGWFHIVHAAMLSRNVAEHLSLDEDGICRLMLACRQWFVANQLPVPRVYVPPAWALGRCSKQRLIETGFAAVETLAGIRLINQRHFIPSPLLGFEADTALRKRLLTISNCVNRRWVSRGARGRLAIHPDDGELLLGHSLRQLVADETVQFRSLSSDLGELCSRVN